MFYRAYDTILTCCLLYNTLGQKAIFGPKSRILPNTKVLYFVVAANHFSYVLHYTTNIPLIFVEKDPLAEFDMEDSVRKSFEMNDEKFTFVPVCKTSSNAIFLECC